jgi:hypothetical protein
MLGGELLSLINGILDTFGISTGDTLDPDNDFLKAYKNINRRGSIRERTKNLILQYPILLSDTVSYDSALLVSRSFEHEYANMLVMIINSDIRAVEDDNLQSYLQNYHTNYGYQGMGDVINDNNIQESTSVKDIINLNKELSEPFDNYYNESILNELSYPTCILENTDLLLENRNQRNNDDDDNKYAEVQYNRVAYEKLNNAQPTIINTCLTIKPSKGSQDIVKKPFTFGVKTIIHSISSEDVVYYLSDSVKNKSKFFRLFKWTTGEISFFKDLVAQSSVMKKMAIDSEKRETFWWRKLKSLSERHFIANLMDLVKRKPAPVPTATLVISKEDVDRIKNKYGIDIYTSKSFAYKIIKDYFLLSLVIVDESTEMFHIFDETSRLFIHYSFDSMRSFGMINREVDGTHSLFRTY